MGNLLKLGMLKRNFKPTDIAGLALWLDADDLTTITESGGAVSQWDDKSGKGNNATQGISVSQPTVVSGALNGRSIIRGDGVNDRLSYPNLNLTGLASVSLFMVLNVDSTGTGFDVVFTFGDTDESRIETRGVTPALKGTFITFVTSFMPSGTIVGAGFEDSNNIFTLTTDGINAISKKNGVIAVNVAQPGNWATGTGNYGLFATNTPNRHLKADIAEVLIYTQTLLPRQIVLIERYLSNKWGIALV